MTDIEKMMYIRRENIKENIEKLTIQIGIIYIFLEHLKTNAHYDDDIISDLVDIHKINIDRRYERIEILTNELIDIECQLHIKSEIPGITTYRIFLEDIYDDNISENHMKMLLEHYKDIPPERIRMMPLYQQLNERGRF